MRLPSERLSLGGKPAADDGVVLGVRRDERAREAKRAGLAPLLQFGRCVGEGVVGRRRCLKECRRVLHYLHDPGGDAFLGQRLMVTVESEPVETPVERAHDAILRDVRKAAFPGVEERC